MAETVLVTGSSGFIASHCVKQLLESGVYTVRGTVRSLKNEETVNAIRSIVPDAKYPVELVEAELLNADSWKDAVRGCSYVLHVASPFPPASTNIQDENTVITPAVEGVKNVLNACAEVGGVKRVVLTSSMFSIAAGNIDKPSPLDECLWADIEACRGAYEKSKLLAEKAAWDLLKDLPEEKKFELAVINPGFVLGPLLINKTCASAEVVKTFMHKEFPMVPKVGMAMIDVRDVALAHIKAMTLPEAAGNRHIIAIPMAFIDIAVALDGEFKCQGYSVPTKSAPNFFMRVASWFDEGAKFILPQVGKTWRIDNSRMTEVLGIEPNDVQQAVVAMAYTLIEAGIVKRTRKYHGKPST